MDLAPAITLLAGLAGAALTPWFSSLMADHVTRGAAKARRVRAYQRLQDDPLVQVGARLAGLFIDSAGGLTRILGPSKITKLELGMIEITADDGRRMNFTGEEFEKLHPVFTPKGKHSHRPMAHVYESGGRWRIKMGMLRNDKFDTLLVSSAEETWPTPEAASVALSMMGFSGEIHGPKGV